MTSDEALLIVARDGDDDAFAELVERHGEPLIRFLAKRLRNESKAEDVAQLAWLKVSQRMGDFQAGRPFKPWLYAIAGNAAKDAMKAEARFHARMERFARPLEWEGPDSVADNEDRQRALALLKSLPKPQREAIYWTIVEGYTSREAGRLLGPSHPTIQKRFHAARVAIKERWEEGQVGTATIAEIRSLAMGDIFDDMPPGHYESLERVLSPLVRGDDKDTASQADYAVFRNLLLRLMGE